MNDIIIDNLAIGYKKKVVAQGLSTHINGGGLTCLIGRNGLGKSTLLRTIAGLQQSLKGKIIIHVGGKDYDVATSSKSTMSHLVSVVLTEKPNVSNMTVFDIVAMGRMPYTNFFGTLREEDRKIVNESLKAVGMETFASRDICTLSDGERQKAMIAKAIAQQTPVIILDEPTAYLDFPSKVETMRLLHSLAHDTGKIILVSTHDLDITARYADKVLTIGNGLKEVGKAGVRNIIDSITTS